VARTINSPVTTQAEYLVASVILGEDNKTLAVGLSGYVNTGFDNRWGPFAAGSLIGAIPVVLLFLFLQRYIVSGLTSGAREGMTRPSGWRLADPAATDRR